MDRNNKGQFRRKFNICKSWLKDQYVDKKLSAPKIANILGCNQIVIYYWLKKYNIPVRTFSEARRGNLNPFYRRSLSEEKILIRSKKIRKIKESKEKLEELYWGKGIPTTKIAQIYGTVASTVCLTFKRLNIPLRPVEETRRLMWQNPEYRTKVIKNALKSLFKRPTNIESHMIDIIERENLPFRYVGNGSVIIGSLNPDFIGTTNHTKIIEVFGDYWHKERVRNLNDTEIGRIATFNSLGYDCLVIWQHELNDEGYVINKIMNFVGGGGAG